MPVELQPKHANQSVLCRRRRSDADTFREHGKEGQLERQRTNVTRRPRSTDLHRHAQRCTRHGGRKGGREGERARERETERERDRQSGTEREREGLPTTSPPYLPTHTDTHTHTPPHTQKHTHTHMHMHARRVRMHAPDCTA